MFMELLMCVWLEGREEIILDFSCLVLFGGEGNVGD